MQREGYDPEIEVAKMVADLRQAIEATQSIRPTPR